MAIHTENTETLVNSKLKSKTVSDIKKPNPDLDSSSVSSKKLSLEKKPGFLKSVFLELKKVEWPTPRYVINWSIVIIFFTVFFSLALGFIDNIYESGIKFVGCTSSEGRNLLYENGSVSSTCFSEFFKNATYQGEQAPQTDQ